jgi:hypothetical protein
MPPTKSPTYPHNVIVLKKLPRVFNVGNYMDGDVVDAGTTWHPSRLDEYNHFIYHTSSKKGLQQQQVAFTLYPPTACGEMVLSFYSRVILLF